MADENKKKNETEPETKEVETPEVKVEEEKEPEKAPDVQALLVEIAKLKRALDKTSSETAEYKKKWQATLSESQKASEEKAQQEAARDARMAELERKDKIHDYTENFMDLGYSKELAKKAAEAQADNDTPTLFDIQRKFQEAAIKAKEAEWLKSRPDISIGAGEAKVTKEQFDNMTLFEKSAFRKTNPDDYERLVGHKK